MVGAVAATSANLPGGPDPRTLDEVPEEIRAAAAAIVDGGELAGDAVDRDRLHRLGAGRAARGRRAGRRRAPGRRLGALASKSSRSSRRNGMAVAQETLDQLRTAGLADVDPEIADAARPRARAAARPDRADRVRELHLAERARGGRLRADEQVRRGLSRPPLLRRLRGRRRDRAARDRPGEGALRRRARERPAARRRAGEHGRLLRAPAAGRHDPRPPARPRRPPHARAQGQLLGPALHDRLVRRLARDEHGRLRRGARDREGAPAEADRLRRLRVPAHGRHGRVPQDRRRGRRAADVRHGPLLRARRRRPAPEPGRALRHRHLDDAQDARRPARRLRPLPRGARAGASTARSSRACRAGRSCT